MINISLAEKLGIKKFVMYDILRLQQHKENILLDMYFLKGAELKDMYKLLVENEYRLQDLWGFPRDAKFHNLHGSHIPHCTCDSLDNKDNVGQCEVRYITCTCPVHGNQ